MLITCWSSKGGSGTTVVAVALALVCARRRTGGALIADLAGDVPAVLGVAEPQGPGLAEWLGAAPDAPASALGRLESQAAPDLAVLHRGDGPLDPAQAGLLVAALAADHRPVVADLGPLGAPLGGPAGAVGIALAAAASSSLLVLRPCFLALRRAAAVPLRPTAVVLVEEDERVLGVADVEEALEVPVRARVRLAPQISRVVDAGLLAARLPRGLARELSGLAAVA